MAHYKNIHERIWRSCKTSEGGNMTNEIMKKKKRKKKKKEEEEEEEGEEEEEE